ncbi:MAG TPA: alpha/beta fold hydrolase [Candidatus Lustribacter sp.]|nr:alpha/beta fold hydrolase [Candidatus Lustribacter sp.]
MSLWLDLLGAEVRFYDAGGIPTRSIQAGSGMPVILLHGGGGHAETYAKNIVPLSRDFDARAIDYYGHGLTGGDGRPPTMDVLVAHFIKYLDAAGIERAHLVGESLGGALAAWTAILHPERVGKLVYCVGAWLKIPDVDPEAQRATDAGLGEFRRLNEQFAANPSRENIRVRLRWLFHKPERDLTDELVDLRWALYEHAARQGTAGEERRGSHMLTPENLARITVPMLFLWTDHNPSQHMGIAKKAMTFVPNAEWALMEDSGHWPQWEHPEIFNKIVTDYLKKT